MRKVLFHVSLCCLILLTVSLSWSQEKKVFPLFLEVSPPVLINEEGFFDAYETNTTYMDKAKSFGLTEANELTFQSYSIGWKFPRDKGKIILTYQNFEEESSDTLINHLSFDEDLAGFVIDEYFDPDLDFQYNTLDGADYLIKNLDGDLGTETTLYDVVFWKEFGKGKRFSGSWNAGLRYAEHDQNVPIGYLGTFDNPYSDIGDNFAGRPYLIQEECRSYGPKGGGVIYFFLFSKRLILSAGADVSLTFGETEVPLQVIPVAIDYEWEFDPVEQIWNVIPFYPEDLGLAPYTISQKEDKSYWFTTVDFNIKFKIFKELYAFVGYRFSDFRNVFLTPTVVNTPTNKDIPPSGLFFSYTFEDISYDTPYFGLSIQF